MFYTGQGPLGSDLSWGMFTITGNPAYYLLYKGIVGPEIGPGEAELTEEQRQRR